MPQPRVAGLKILALLGAVICLMFIQSFQPGVVHSSNDGPLGANMAEHYSLPESFLGIWQTLNWVGGWSGSATPNFTNLLLWLLGPIGFAKFYAPVSILVLGLCAWLAFKQLRFNPVTCLIAALATALNTGFFSYACWGLGTLTLTIASFFLALAAWGGDPARRSWLRVVLAGFAIGLGIMEGFDSGAILSVYFAAYVMARTWIESPGQPPKLAGGAARVVVIAVAAGVLATHAMYSLIATQIQGVAGMAQDQETREQRWAEATMWSLPKTETLRLFIAGFHGYRLDTPDGGAYWGGVGRHPVWEEFLAQDDPNPQQAPNPAGLRHSGSGFYCGVFVCLLALWTIFRSLGNRGELFRMDERRLIWFWALMALGSLLLSWGKHAPFYAIAYELPYFSTIRNPIKFLHPLNISILMLFAHGLEGLWRSWQKQSTAGSTVGQRFGNWWRTAQGFERHWIIGSAAGVAVCIFLVLLYGTAREEMTRYLMLVGYADSTGGPTIASAIFRHSIRELGWFILFLVVGAATIAVLMSGALRRSGSGTGLLVLLLVVTGLDLVRANLPWRNFYNYESRYANTPLYEFLAKEPWEHRAQFLPGGLLEYQMSALHGRVAPAQFGQLTQMVNNLASLYYGQWQQQQFQFYNIQSLDLVQEPRPVLENVVYRSNFPPNDPRAQIRLLRLTNARYFLAPGASTLTPLNQLLRPEEGEFRDVLPLWMAMDQGEIRPIIETNSPLALIEFTGALPRARLFSNWQIEPDPTNALAILRSAEFDPAKRVLVESELPAPTDPETDPGTVEITDYRPKHVQMSASVKAPAVLLFNDKHDPHWKVWVSGEPATLLKCNFLMRGVHLEPGQHEIVWKFQPPSGTLYVSVAAILAGLVMVGFVAFAERRTAAGTAKN
ncbi:MAG TPA: hypothetical protein DCY13_00190 [Verrucomicrobiales bacterium]|nr:hypothetical protein [Verrucomicrobiales bacterium]